MGRSEIQCHPQPHIDSEARLGYMRLGFEKAKQNLTIKEVELSCLPQEKFVSSRKKEHKILQPMTQKAPRKKVLMS